MSGCCGEQELENDGTNAGFELVVRAQGCAAARQDAVPGVAGEPADVVRAGTG